MLAVLLRHLRSNLVAYLALLFALSSTSYAGGDQAASGQQRRHETSNQRLAAQEGL
jgi:hypothetical protein